MPRFDTKKALLALLAELTELRASVYGGDLRWTDELNALYVALTPAPEDPEGEAENGA